MTDAKKINEERAEAAAEAAEAQIIEDTSAAEASEVEIPADEAPAAE